MAAAFVQDDHLASTGVNQQVIAFGSNVTAGSMIVVVARTSDASSVTSISDSLGSTYSSVVTHTDGSTRISIWAAVNAGAGANSVTINYGASNNPQAYIQEWSGMVTASVAAATDQTGTNSTSGVVNHPANASALTPSEDNCLVIGAASFNGTVTWQSAEAGYTHRTGSDGTGASRCHTVSIVQTTATATDADQTTAATAQGANAMAIFKAAAGAGGGGVRPSTTNFLLRGMT